LDADFLLGPEAAHLNISGVSGLATKTSAVEFLLASIFQHFPAHKGRIAALCFNVKGPDLCFLDRPGALDDADRRRYERLGITPQPFERVRYYAPFKADGVNLNTLRTHPDLVGDVEPLVWGLSEVLDFAEVLLNRDDIDAKADAFIDFLSDRVLNKEFDDGFGGGHRVQTFADLDGLFRAIFDGLELSGRSDMWRTHHIATIRKVRNRLSNISTRCKGLVTDDGPSSDLPWGRFEDRSVYVVDVANVDPLGQDLVFARAVKIKLATLPIGELMVRHPHFTQPIFVRFPRPAVLRGRDGVERFPPAADLSFEDAVVRQLARLDRRIRPNQVKDLIAERRPDD